MFLGLIKPLQNLCRSSDHQKKKKKKKKRFNIEEKVP